jgi:deoxycytidylate deaminase
MTNTNITDRHEYFFHEAMLVAREATCLRARCGSVVVSKDGIVIGRGFNAPPLSDENQRKCSETYLSTRKPKSDRTCCVHAEWNAILNASINNGLHVAGSTLYFMRVDEDGNMTNAGEPYCTVCSRLALQSGVSVFGLWEDGPRMIPTDEYNEMSYSYFETKV